MSEAAPGPKLLPCDRFTAGTLARPTLARICISGAAFRAIWGRLVVLGRSLRACSLPLVILSTRAEWYFTCHRGFGLGVLTFANVQSFTFALCPSRH